MALIRCPHCGRAFEFSGSENCPYCRGSAYRTCRTDCLNGRAAYRPDWSDAAPWVTYWRGCAGLHFATLEEAAAYFKTRHGATLNTKA